MSGKTTTLTLYDDGSLKTSTDPNTLKTTFVRDALGRMTGTINPLGKTESQLLNASDAGVSSTDRDGHTRYSVYDALGRLIASRDALGNFTQYVYDANGNLIKSIDPRGNATKYEYDALNRLTKTTDAAGNITQSAYDANGNVTLQTDALGKLTTSAYDIANRLTSVQTFAGTTLYGYNDRNQQTSVTDRLTKTTTYEYSDGGFQTKVTFADNSSVVYAYDENGNRTSVTDANGNVTTFTFNESNQVATQVDPFSDTTTFEYDTGGRNTAIVDRIGRRREFSYDNADRMTQEVWKSPTSVLQGTLTFAFSDAGNLTSANSNVGGLSSTYTLNYDANDRVTGVSEPFGKSLTFTFDAAGNRVLVQDSASGTVTSTYNSLNLLSSRQISVTGGPTLRADFAYTARHQLGTVTRYDTLTTATKVGESVYAYDDAMRATSITHKNGAGTTLASLVYAYDAGDRLTSETIGGTTTNYTYKTNTDQLESDGTTTWLYDANGNRTSGGSSPTTGNRLTTDGTYTYAYDDESNVITKTDGSGNHWDYVYDHRNQMTQAKYTNAGGTVVQTNDYSYGPFGERLKVVHTESGNNFTREFAYDAWNPAKQGGVGNEAFDIWADMDGANAITMRYFDGDNVDGKLARAVGAAEQWLLSDKLGSIRDITNSSGTLVNTVAYDAWGKVLSQTGSGSNDVGRYAFTGRERDVETGLQYNRARYYDPVVGRWQTQDPMGFDAGDSNLNRYVKNAPTNYTDPSGFQGAGWQDAKGPDSDWWVGGYSHVIVSFREEIERRQYLTVFSKGGVDACGNPQPAGHGAVVRGFFRKVTTTIPVEVHFKKQIKVREAELRDAKRRISHLNDIISERTNYWNYLSNRLESQNQATQLVGTLLGIPPFFPGLTPTLPRPTGSVTAGAGGLFGAAVGISAVVGGAAVWLDNQEWAGGIKTEMRLVKEVIQKSTEEKQHLQWKIDNNLFSDVRWVPTGRWRHTPGGQPTSVSGDLVHVDRSVPVEYGIPPRSDNRTDINSWQINGPAGSQTLINRAGQVVSSN